MRIPRLFESYPSLDISYQGLRVKLEDHAGVGEGDLGKEDIAEIQLPDGSRLEGSVLDDRLKDPEFFARVNAVISAYGPVLSKPFQHTGDKEWNQLANFWMEARPEHWLRYIAHHPKEADRKDFAIRQEFLRANRSTSLPPALQEAVAIHRMLGQIRTIYKQSLGLKRFDTLVDQKSIDEQIIGPVVQKYPQAISALLYQLGDTPLTDAILSATIWKDGTFKTLVPSWTADRLIGKHVTQILDKQGLAGLEALLKTPTNKQLEHIIHYCSWLTLLPKNRLGQERFDRLFSMVMRAIPLVTAPLDKSSQRLLWFGQYENAFFSILDDETAVTGMSPQQAMEALLLMDRYQQVPWRYWDFAFSRPYARMLLRVDERWRTGLDVQALADVLVAHFASNRKNVDEHGQFFLELALHLHNKLANEESRTRLGTMILDLLDRDFQTLYVKVARAQLLPPTGARLDALFARHYAGTDATVQVAARFARWAGQQLDFPDDIGLALTLLEQHGDLTGDYEVHQRIQEHEWWRTITPEGAKILTDLLLSWLQFNKLHGFYSDIRLILGFLYPLHNRLADPADRVRVGDIIEQWIASPRMFHLEYPWTTAHQLAEPTKSRFTTLLEARLQSDDPGLQRSARFARMLSQRHLPKWLNQALRLAYPGSLEHTYHNDAAPYRKAVESDPWFTSLNNEDVALLTEHIIEWDNFSVARDRKQIGDREQTLIRLSFLARLHNQATDPELRRLIADRLAGSTRNWEYFAEVLLLAEDMPLEEPALSAIRTVYENKKTRSEIPVRQYILSVQLRVAYHALSKVFARNNMAERAQAYLDPAVEFESEDLIVAYPLLTTQEQNKIEDAVMAYLTFAESVDLEMTKRQHEILEVFLAAEDLVSPALRKILMQTR